MHCGACVKLSASALEGLPGVTKVEVKKDGTTTIESENELKWDDVKDALATVDKTAVLL